MNTPILFLLGAVALSGLGGIIVWIASRPRPERFGSSIDTFNRDLDALAPPGSKSHGRRPARPLRPNAQRPNSPRANSQPARRSPAPTNGAGPRPVVKSPNSTAASVRPKPGPRPGPRS